MKNERLLRILAALADAAPPSPDQLCTVCVQVLEVAGAAVMVDGVEHRAPLCSSDDLAAQIEDLGLTLGEGPGVDAHHSGVPVIEPDLVHPRETRWPSFTPLAVKAGVAAIFAFPLRMGGVHLGALTLHQLRRGHLSSDQHQDAQVRLTLMPIMLVACMSWATARIALPCRVFWTR